MAAHPLLAETLECIYRRDSATERRWLQSVWLVWLLPDCWPIVHCQLDTTSLYTVHCTLYTVPYTMYTVQYTMYTLHCTLYTCQQFVQKNGTCYNWHVTTDMWYINIIHRVWWLLCKNCRSLGTYGFGMVEKWHVRGNSIDIENMCL